MPSRKGNGLFKRELANGVAKTSREVLLVSVLSRAITKFYYINAPELHCLSAWRKRDSATYCGPQCYLGSDLWTSIKPPRRLWLKHTPKVSPFLQYEMASVKEIDLDVELTNSNYDTKLSVIHRADDALLRKLGYKSEFKREFSVCPRHGEVLPDGDMNRRAFIALRDDIIFPRHFVRLRWHH